MSDEDNTTGRISDREDAGGDKYAASVFVPTDLRNGINRILRVYGLDIPQTFGNGVGRPGDIWDDEEDVIRQFAGMEPVPTEQDAKVIADLEAHIAMQRDEKEKSDFYFVYVKADRPWETGHFTAMGFPSKEDY